ncbi:GtrA family protein [Arcticibacter eurypsychrophilus]|uniref:GtrA family protein n=1 Tax=Arcticibacter eurypsychrophilus TaxID=1434752 RepID=UPI00084DC123|nr:GtrA family protein [Arcticibacter eurypsychrophilus]
MELIRKIFLFGFVGLIGMCIDFGLTWLFKEKLQVNKYAANTIGFSVAVVNNFILNYLWTFHAEEKNIHIFFFKFLLFAVIGLGLNTLIIYLFNERFLVPFYVSKVLAIAIVFIWNFTANNFLNF